MKSLVAKSNVVKCGMSQTKNVNIETLFCWEIQSVNKSQSFKGIISTWYIAPSLHCKGKYYKQLCISIYFDREGNKKSRYNWESWVIWLSADTSVNSQKFCDSWQNTPYLLWKTQESVFATGLFIVNQFNQFLGETF